MPIKQHKMGLWVRRAIRTMAWAVPRALVMDWGVKITSAPSTPSSLITAARAFSYRSCAASPITSTGLLRLAVSGQMARQGLYGVIAEFGQVQSRGNGHVGGHNPRTAGVGDDGHPVAIGYFTAKFAQVTFIFIGKGAGKIKQLVDGIDPDNAGLLKNGIIYRFGAGQRTGMGSRRFGTGAGSPGFYHQNRRGSVSRK